MLEERGAAVVIEEKNLSPELLRSTVAGLCEEPQTLCRLGKNAQKMAVLDANERIYREIISLIGT